VPVMQSARAARRPLKSYQYYYSSGMNESNLRRRLGLETKFAAPRSDSKQRRAYQYLTAFCVYFHMCAPLQGLNSLLAPSSLFLSLSLLCKQPNRFLRLEHIFIMFRRHTIQLYSLAAECVIWPAALVGPFHCCERATKREPTMRSALREATSSAVMPKS
jgi:hypothetical protein